MSLCEGLLGQQKGPRNRAAPRAFDPLRLSNLIYSAAGSSLRGILRRCCLSCNSWPRSDLVPILLQSLSYSITRNVQEELSNTALEAVVVGEHVASANTIHRG